MSLVTIEKIARIRDLEESRKVEVIEIENSGWECIVPKGKFQQGGLCVFAKAGTFFPNIAIDAHPDLLYVKNVFNGRVKTLRLFDQVSDGYAMQLDTLPKENFSIHIGRDVTELLNATDWGNTMGIFDQVQAIGPAPSTLPVVKERILQSNLRLLRPLSNTEFYAIEKINGMAATFYFQMLENKTSFGVCSKKLELNPSSNHPLVIWARENNLRDKMKSICQSSEVLELDLKNPCIFLQGDFVQPSLPGVKNKYKLEKNEIFFTHGGIANAAPPMFSRHLLNKFCYENRLNISPLVFPSLYISNQGLFNSLKNNLSSFLRKFSKIGQKHLAPKIKFRELIDSSKLKSRLNDKTEMKGLIIKPVSNNLFLSEENSVFLIQNPEFLLRNNR